jgi:hypothetical protein
VETPACQVVNQSTRQKRRVAEGRQHAQAGALRAAKLTRRIASSG